LDGLCELAVIELAEVHGILPIVAEIAARHALIPEVGGSALLERRDALSPMAVLLSARRESRARHVDLDATREDAERVLRDHGVPYRHLKGGALRLAGVWADFTARPTRDVDILVADPLAIPAIEKTLIAEGFRRSDEVATSRAWQDDHHDQPLVRGDRAGSLELHAAALVKRHRSRIVLDVSSQGDDPDLATTLRHIIIHADLQDDALLQWRLPIVSLLDVAFALESGALTGSQLIEGLDDRSARRAARIHLGLAGRLRGIRFAGSAPTALRWWASAWLFAHPLAAYLMREAAFAPRALSRPVMSARLGRPMYGTALARARVDFLLTRVPLGARGARGVRGNSHGGVAARMIPVERVEPMTPRAGVGERLVREPDWGVIPALADGFEAVWSSSGLVLVDLEKDVLHHLNQPAAVVYDLVGDRSAAEIAAAFSALAELSEAESREAVAFALASLGAIGSVTGWPATA
jgi:hypothetical protein